MDEKLLKKLFESDAGQKILLYGPPGTGKTTAAWRVCKGDAYMVSLHQDMMAHELSGHWMPHKGEFTWFYGIAARAFLEGKTLIINELDQASPAMMSELHKILDDPEVAMIELRDSEDKHKSRLISPKKGYKVIATMNGDPEDLSPAVQDRMTIRLHYDSPAKGLLNLLSPVLQTALLNSYGNPDIPITARETKKFHELTTGGFSEKDAIKVIWGYKRSEDMAKVLALLKEFPNEAPGVAKRKRRIKLAKGDDIRVKTAKTGAKVSKPLTSPKLEKLIEKALKEVGVGSPKERIEKSLEKAGMEGEVIEGEHPLGIGKVYAIKVAKKRKIKLRKKETSDKKSEAKEE